MSVLYHITNLPPKIPGTEAVLQEAEWLRSHFGGQVIFINPNQHSPLYLPRLFFGLHLLRQIKTAEKVIQLHHLYNADPFPFPILRGLRRPVVYSVGSGLGSKRPFVPFFAGLAAVTVSDERSFQRLKDWGLANVFLARPGIDTAHFTYTPVPLRSEIRLMVGSAPWTLSQFRAKGIDALLAAAKEAPQLHLIFLWRGILADELARRVDQLNLGEQVEVINERADVNQVLSRVHASITLATNPAIIRAYPHSLLESLAAGKPVIISRSIPMADYVEQTGCGLVVERTDPSDILAAVELLAHNYTKFQRLTLQAGQRDFSRQALIDTFEKVYAQVLKVANGRIKQQL